MLSRTETQIIAMLREQLGNKTILTIAHRLMNLANSDLILSLDTNGTLESYQNPKILIYDEKSQFFIYSRSAGLVDEIRKLLEAGQNEPATDNKPV